MSYSLQTDSNTMVDVIGRKYGPYRIESKLGEGGMGVVFRARDERLGRDVAIKVLPSEAARDEERLRRFETEAKAAASLDHPNVVVVHDVGTSRGRPYVVEELLEGKTLKQRIRDGGLTVATAVEYGIQIARGLECAHSKGIIHRDLKSENLFVTNDGLVKILDFGIAKLSEVVLEGGQERERTEKVDTQPGGLLGTTGYMSPEQVRGLPADARSDLFSLGVVLYEMLSGRRPFRGATPGETFSMILNDDPPELGPPVPAALQEIVICCLKKRPEDRFDSAHDVAAALESVARALLIESRPQESTRRATSAPARVRMGTNWRVVAAAFAGLVIGAGVMLGYRYSPLHLRVQPLLVPNRIAVLPFENLSEDTSLDLLGRNAAGRIRVALSQLADVEEVVLFEPEDTVGTDSVASVAAATTGAALVVTGACSLNGDQPEIIASLYDARERRTVRELGPATASPISHQTSVQSLCDRLMVVVQDHLHPCITFGGSDRIPRIDAYTEYRKGIEGGATASIDEIEQNLMRAVELDPDFVRPRLFLAGALTFTDYGVVDPRYAASHFDKVLPARRDLLTASQQNILAAIRYRAEGNWLGAWRVFDEELRTGLDTFPLRVYVIDSAVRANRLRRATEVFRGLQWDPIEPPQPWAIASTAAGTAYHLLGEYERELAAVTTGDITRVVKKRPLWTRTVELRALAAMGRIDHLNALLSEILAERPYWPARPGQMMLDVAEELRAHGFREASSELAQRALEWLRTSGLVEAGDSRAISECGRALSLLGRPDEAYTFVRDSFQQQPDSFDKWASIGVAAARLRDWDTTGEMAASLAEVGDPFDHGRAAYHRARMAALLGDVEGALHLLRTAIVDGFADWARVHRDPDIDPLRGHPEFQAMLRPKG